MDLRKQHFVMPSPATHATHASPYSNSEEKTQHERIIGMLANETSRSIAEVEPLYEDILAHLKDRASVQDYLPILVSRRVKALLS
jgi:hypothetical protein